MHGKRMFCLHLKQSGEIDLLHLERSGEMGLNLTTEVIHLFRSFQMQEIHFTSLLWTVDHPDSYIAHGVVFHAVLIVLEKGCFRHQNQMGKYIIFLACIKKILYD
jgi:hypothetical protein